MSDDTCQMVWGLGEWDDPDHYWCTNCGAPLPDEINEKWFAYIEGRCERPVDCCPRCGAKVVDE